MNEPTNNIEQARLAALYQVSSQLGVSLDLSEVLNQVMDAIILLTGAERGFLMLFDDLTGRLRTEAARNVDRETIEGESMQISRTVLQRAATTGDPILTSNAQEDERFSDQQSVIGYQLRSIMCVPLRARARIIGAVYVDNRLYSGVFKEADLELLGTFANQAAIAIDNARLFTQTDHALARRVEELTVFQQIDQQLNKSLELNQVLSSALTWAIALTTADSGSIGLLVETETEPALRLLVNTSAGGEPPRTVLTDHPVLAQVLREERSVYLEQVSAAESLDGRAAAVQLAVPIKRDGLITGLITLESRTPQAINDEDIAFVERLADRAAVAIKNARLYEDIHAANKAKSDFISVVTHELRLPMTSIKGYTDLIMSGMTGELNEQQKQFLGVIKRNLDRMSVLIRDLSDINRIESGRMQFEVGAFDVRDVVMEVVESFQEQAGTKSQTLRVEVGEGDTAVSADSRRVSQVLTNLVSNANKYTPPNGDILIQVQPQAAFVQVSVRDTGIGISEENQAQLFNQFFRAEDAAVREQVGWGLGLSIVKKMVEAQGGEIWFQSTFGEGSTFAFTLPSANITRELE
ncbi:MAG: GAF domain-containing protein [Chloroflexi bacterium]|nr:GAF domain-containing protein [Chloroflexota bacterium]MBK8933312.1 GAF domain-containing protein [Chloroflexota bacterium]MBP7590071.1 GAF domain-containing protein [Chloroflexota bacterium]